MQPGSGDTINIVGAFVNFFSFIPTIYFSNRFGRRFNLMGGIAFQLVAYVIMIIMTVSNAPWWLQSIPVMMTFIGFGVGMGGTVFLYMSEFLPNIAMGICLFWQWIVTCLIAKFVPPFLTAVGAMWLMIFFAANCLTGTVLCWAYCIETKDKSEKQIHKEFMKA